MVGNPISALRAKHNLTRRQLAAVIGCSYTLVTALEAGDIKTVGPTIKLGLIAVGEDPEAIAREYAEWRTARTAQAREALGHAG